MDELTDLLTSIGPEVEDVDEESFFLFSQDIPSSNLGFVDSRAQTVDVSIHGHDYVVHQSPTLLSSSRAGGTTGAVLWKITPLIAEWLSNKSTANPLWTTSVLNPSSIVLELGCGISSLLALTLAPSIRHYVATDQEYVRRFFRENVDENSTSSSSSSSSSRIPPKGRQRRQKQQHHQQQRSPTSRNITFAALDWETDIPASLKQSIELTPSTEDKEEEEEEEEEEDKGFDVLLSCDCIYNEALIAPLVRTCADFCRLRPVYIPPPPPSSDPHGQTQTLTQNQNQRGNKKKRPTVCIVAQQQRSPDVFEAWLRETMRYFRVWRAGDEVLGEKLCLGSGYLVHVLVLREV